ncbi:MAG: permease, partial [Candidatus Thorarchaeota archaeon]
RDILIGWGVSKPAMIQTIIWGVGVMVLIVCLFVIRNIRMNIFLILLYILFTGTSQITYFVSESTIETLSWMDPVVLSNMGIKAALTLAVTIIAVVYSLRKVKREDLKEWMKETWDFVKKIFPYIIIGVFIAGMLQVLIPPEFIQNLVGENTIVANSIGVAFGVIAYFPTLMEVPIAKMFLNLGMSRGVLLAYLLADPELSIQSILVTRKFLGDKKNLIYVLLVAVFTIIAGLLFGLIVSKEPIKFI